MMRRPSMTRRGLGLSAALIVASLSLGGCEVVQRSRTAAFVNGQAISVEDVAETTRQYNQFLVTDPSQQLTEARAAGTLVLAGFVVAHVEKAGTWKPDARYVSDLAKVPDASEHTKELLKFVSISNAKALTPQDVAQIIATMSAAKIEMDPRYGTFSPTDGGFVQQQPNWVVPTPTATAPAQPGQ